MLSGDSFFRGTADEETVAGVAEGEGAEEGKNEGTDEGMGEGEDSAGTSGKSASTDDGIEGIEHAVVTDAEHKEADLRTPSSNNTHKYMSKTMRKSVTNLRWASHQSVAWTS